MRNTSNTPQLGFFRAPVQAALLGAVVISLVLGLAVSVSLARYQPQTTGDHMFRSVQLVVSYGDDVEKRWGMLRWTQGMTALDAMKLAAAKPVPLGLAFDSVGTGERAFVKAIDGLTNEGGKPGQRNWVFSINDRRGDRSCGATVLEAGDTLTWTYAPMGEPPAR